MAVITEEEKKKQAALGARPAGSVSFVDKVGMIADKINPVAGMNRLAGGKVGNLVAPIQDAVANTAASAAGMERPNKTAIGDGAFQYDEDANKPLLPDGTVGRVVKNAAQNAFGWKPAAKEVDPVATTPQIAQGTIETAKQNATVQALAADPNAAIGARQKTTGAVQDPSSPQNTAPVAAENVAVNTPSQQLGARKYDSLGKNAPEIQSGNNVYNPASQSAVAVSERLINQEGGGIGAGIVSRGMVNRAKSFADMSNANDASQANVQNSNTNSTESASRNAERARAGDQSTQESQIGARKTEADIASKEMDNSQRKQLAELQNKYLDPKTDEATRASIAAQLSALNGKEAKDKYTPLMGKDELGNPTYLGAFNTRDGSIVQQNAQAAPGTQISSAGKMTPQQEALAAIATGGITKEEANKRLIAAGQQPV
jgi:hypothetical protein